MGTPEEQLKKPETASCGVLLSALRIARANRAHPDFASAGVLSEGRRTARRALGKGERKRAGM